jgi:hypothetical protein
MLFQVALIAEGFDFGGEGFDFGHNLGIIPEKGSKINKWVMNREK